jgi:uncharacterized surface protein with fasciclin (FAS1) repeats
MRQRSELSFLVNAIRVANLEKVFEEKRGQNVEAFTLFAPTNEAFAKVICLRNIL